MLPDTLPAFIWHFIKKHPIAFAVFFIAPALVVLESVILPYSIKMIIDAFTEYQDKREMIMTAISPALWLAGISWISLVVLLRLQEWWQVHVLPKFEADIRMSVTEYLAGHSYEYFSNNSAGNLTKKINDLPQSIDSLGMLIRWSVIATLAVIITSMVLIFRIQPLFALIIGCWIVIDLTISLSMMHFINNPARKNAEDKSVLNGKIVDMVYNIIPVKLFAKNNYEKEYIAKFQKNERNSNKHLRFNIMVHHFVIDLPLTIMLIIIGYLLITYWQKDLITTGDFAFIFNSIIAIMFRLWFLGESLTQIFKDYGTASQALSLIMQPHDVQDMPDATELKVTKGKIVFDDVTFHYNRGKSVFENKDITIKGGEKVGLVGFSGSGKTTFVNLILRFFDVEFGQILIDGQDISLVTQESLRRNIAMIPQDSILFHRTIMDNIRYGNIDASDAEVIKAAKQAKCHDFIKAMPEGYNTMVGDRGIKLSGGQRQRIAIARAILKNAPILILDEATSALDSMTEKHIQESLHNLMEKRTAIVIAHRLSTLSEMDRIVVFDKGNIVEDGSHEELLSKDGHYARMWAMQAGGFLPEKEQE